MVSIAPALVPVASRDLKKNHRVTASDLSEASVAPLPVGTATAAAEVLNKYLREKKAKGDPFLASDVCNLPLLPSSTQQLFAVSVSAVQAFHGLLEPDSSVDLYGTPKGGTAATALAANATLVALIETADSAQPAQLAFTLILAAPPGDLTGIKDIAGATDLIVVARGR